MDKLDMQTKNIADKNYAALAKLFPNALTEKIIGYGENGKAIVERAIDVDVLRQEISCSVVEGREERYQFTWPDKKKAILLANAPTTATLRPCSEESVNFSETENLYIEGDNLDVLKLLQETYLGKIKTIYIDPPYNTGNDFLYEDDFTEDVTKYLYNSGQYDEQGNRLFKNLDTNGRFHTDWLNMVYTRIKLAKNLLSNDGVLFISIDDNELENLKKICAEILGEHNYIATFIWEKRKNRENRKIVSVRHDYILCYCKNCEFIDKAIAQLPMNEEALSRYSNIDNDPRGPWKSDPAHAQAGHGTKNQFYELVAPNGKVHQLPSGRCWVYTQEVMNEKIRNNEIWFGADGNNAPRIKTYLYAKERGLNPETMLFADDVSTNEVAKNKLKALFDGKAIFETPKPVELLVRLLEISKPKDDIVLDFFSGSGTIGEAVFNYNVKNRTNAKFITIQIPELCDNDSIAFREGYSTICDIGKERIRKAGERIEGVDTGFRVLKLDSSNMKDIYYNPEQIQQHTLFESTDNIKEDRTPEDLLFQVMLDLGVLLSSKIEEKNIAGKKVFNVADGFLIACFDNDVTEETVKAVAQEKPYYAVFRDSCMANDSVATNFEQIFATYSPETVRKVL